MKTQSTVIFHVAVFCAAFVLARPALAGFVELRPTDAVGVTKPSDTVVNGNAIIFDLSSIPAEASVDLAELVLTVDSDTMLGRKVNVFVFTVIAEWSAVGQYEVGDIETADSLFNSTAVMTGDERDVSLNVTDLVNRWYGGQLTNCGFYVVAGNNEEKRLFRVASSGGEIDATLKVFFSK